MPELCNGSNAQLRDGIPITRRIEKSGNPLVSGGVLRIACPFLVKGLCVADNDTQVAYVKKVSTKMFKTKGEGIENCIQGDGSVVLKLS